MDNRLFFLYDLNQTIVYRFLENYNWITNFFMIAILTASPYFGGHCIYWKELDCDLFSRHICTGLLFDYFFVIYQF